MFLEGVLEKIRLSGRRCNRLGKKPEATSARPIHRLTGGQLIAGSRPKWHFPSAATRRTKMASGINVPSRASSCLLFGSEEFRGLAKTSEREPSPFSGAALFLVCKHPGEVTLIDEAAG